MSLHIVNCFVRGTLVEVSQNKRGPQVLRMKDVIWKDDAANKCCKSGFVS